MTKFHLPVAFRGFLFGMTLHMAIGPVCLFIFTTASTSGILNAEAGVAGVTIIDALYIVLALAGASRLFNRNGLKKFIGVSGAAIVALFGIKLIICGIHPPRAALKSVPFATTAVKTFITALLLTASNPLTIIFWTGVFGARLNSLETTRESPIFFSAGCIGATLVFLSMAAALGSILHNFVPAAAISILNITAGVLFIVFSIKRIIGQLRSPAAANQC